jgi:hypothetical protein
VFSLGAFGIARRDLSMTYRLSVTNKNIDLLGFTPVITFAHTTGIRTSACSPTTGTTARSA